MCTVKREEFQTDSNYFQLDYFPMNIKKLACSINNEASFTSHIIAHNFLKKSYNRNVFHGEHIQQRSHQGAQKIMHQNFEFFQFCTI